MLEQGWGRIVNIASTASLKGYAYVSAYCAAKHAVLGLTRALALELAKKPVTINAVCPGYTETDIVRDSLANIQAKTGRSLAEAEAELVKHNPQGRLVQPEEVANAVLWLCQPGHGSRHRTGDLRIRRRNHVTTRNEYMSDTSYLDWPFFDESTPQLQARTGSAGLAAQCHRHAHHGDTDGACRDLVARLGAAGWLRYAVGGTGLRRPATTVIDTRAICLLRETLARHSGLADFAFAMQGLGSGALTLHGSAEQKQRYLTRVAAGDGDRRLRPFRAGIGLGCRGHANAPRVPMANDYVLDGEKTWISNGGIADFYVVFARTGEAPGSRGLSAFVVDADTPGFEIAERIECHRPASAGAPALHQLPRPEVSAGRRARHGLQGGHADAGHLPHLRRRGRPRLRPPRARRSPAPRNETARCSTRRWPTSRSPRPSSRRWPPASTSRRC
jgi:hypothetical protein